MVTAQQTTSPKEGKMLKVTFTYTSRTGRTFVNVELHRSMDDARLRALALNWQVAKVEAA